MNRLNMDDFVSGKYKDYDFITTTDKVLVNNLRDKGYKCPEIENRNVHVIGIFPNIINDIKKHLELDMNSNIEINHGLNRYNCSSYYSETITLIMNNNNE